MMAAGFEKMKRLARRAAAEGAPNRDGRAFEVPFAGRGEAPWREIELLVESGFTPLEAITQPRGPRRGSSTGAKSWVRCGRAWPRILVVLDQYLEEHPEHPDCPTGHGVWRMGRRRALPEVLTRR